jgi:hypothetical protein
MRRVKKGVAERSIKGERREDESGRGEQPRHARRDHVRRQTCVRRAPRERRPRAAEAKVHARVGRAGVAVPAMRQPGDGHHEKANDADDHQD